MATGPVGAAADRVDADHLRPELRQRHATDGLLITDVAHQVPRRELSRCCPSPCFLYNQSRDCSDKQNVQRQHDALDAICVRMFEKTISGTKKATERPTLQAALDYLREGDLLTVQEVDRLGRNLLEGLLVLSDLFERGVAVRILEGIAAGEHTERSLILDLALAEDRRRDISRKTKNGLEAAKRQGRRGDRPTVLDDDKRRAILSRRREGQSLRQISRGVGVSVAVVHGAVQTNPEEDQA